MTTLQHVYAIKNLLSSGAVADDFKYSNSLILHFLEISRALLMEQKASKYHTISELSYQSKCMDLELGGYHSCCGTDTGCKLLRTKELVPKLISTRFGNFIKVTTLNGDIIPHAFLNESKYAKYAIATLPKTTYSIHDGKIFIHGNTNLEKILVNGVFTSPGEALEKCPENEVCKSYMDENFPIDADLVLPAYKIAIEMLTQNRQPDLENDSKDETS